MFEGEAFQDVFNHRYITPDSASTEVGNSDSLKITDVTDDEGSMEQYKTHTKLHELMRGREKFLSPEQQWMIPRIKVGTHETECA